MNHTDMSGNDAKLMNEVQSIRECNILQHYLNKMQQWSDKWLMKFNPSKTKVIKRGEGKNSQEDEFHSADTRVKM